MTDRYELRRLAQAATPGPWDFSDSAEEVSCEQRYAGSVIPIASVELGWNEPLDSEQRANGEFIAAANPATVIELLDEIEQLRADAARYQFIRAGGAYVEPSDNSLYVALDERGKYYNDLRDLDMDIDEAIATQRGER